MFFLEKGQSGGRNDINVNGALGSDSGFRAGVVRAICLRTVLLEIWLLCRGLGMLRWAAIPNEFVRVVVIVWQTRRFACMVLANSGGG